eukprot:2922416-Pleurochrysis_carterae.AAC.1
MPGQLFCAGSRTAAMLGQNMARSPSAHQDRPEQVSSLLCVHPTLHESAYLLRTVKSTRSATL